MHDETLYVSVIILWKIFFSVTLIGFVLILWSVFVRQYSPYDFHDSLPLRPHYYCSTPSRENSPDLLNIVRHCSTASRDASFAFSTTRIEDIFELKVPPVVRDTGN